MIELRPQALDLIERVQNFIDEEIAHNENLYHEQSKDEDGTWVVPPIMEEMKAKAKSAGLWNLFLPESENGAGLTNYEYAHLAEAMGAYGISSEVFNCSAPDTGNMEVLERYGNEEHKEKYLKPLLEGEIRSAFGMTEPGVASSDATNIASTAVLEGDEYVINGEKWLDNMIQCSLEIIPCLNYNHNTRYVLPIPPSPNLPNMRSVYLYPSLCFFEGTNISIGRGTNFPFQVFEFLLY